MSYTAFSVAAFTPNANPPDAFFPAISPVLSEADLVTRPTLLVTPAASVKLLIGTNRYTLTAGARAADTTHLLPNDYDATTNAKHWFKT